MIDYPPILSARNKQVVFEVACPPAGSPRRATRLQPLGGDASLANGANILKVNEMAGHASFATAQRYLHDREALADTAVDCNPLTHP